MLNRSTSDVWWTGHKAFVHCEWWSRWLFNIQRYITLTIVYKLQRLEIRCHPGSCRRDTFFYKSKLNNGRCLVTKYSHIYLWNFLSSIDELTLIKVSESQYKVLEWYFPFFFFFQLFSNQGPGSNWRGSQLYRTSHLHIKFDFCKDRVAIVFLFDHLLIIGPVWLVLLAVFF